MGETAARSGSGRTSTILALIALIVMVIVVVAASLWLVGPNGPAHDAVGALDSSMQAEPSPAVGSDGLFPTRIALPTVGVAAAVEPRRSMPVATADHERTTPPFALPVEKSNAAWWSNGPRPGSDGLSVIVGRSGDSTGPGAFDSIGAMRRGDKIVLRSAQDQVVTYLVSEVKSGFRAADPVALQRSLGTAQVAGAVALVNYDVDQRVTPEPLADVVFGHLRKD